MKEAETGQNHVHLAVLVVGSRSYRWETTSLEQVVSTDTQTLWNLECVFVSALSDGPSLFQREAPRPAVTADSTWKCQLGSIAAGDTSTKHIKVVSKNSFHGTVGPTDEASPLLGSSSQFLLSAER